MSDTVNDTPIDNPEWPLRPWILAAILGAAGFAIWLAGGGDALDTQNGLRAAMIAFALFGGLVLAFTLERAQWRSPAIFAALAGLVMAGLAWRAIGGGDNVAGPQYGFLAGAIATGLALPLFQAGFHRTRFATPYPLVHHYVWTDAITAAGSLAFTGASWLLLVLLSELFRLLRIEFLVDLIDEGWFGWTWSGAAFGAALGVLRNESGVLGTLKRVVMTVLSILAVPLAAGLALFLLAMAISGPDVLWQATRSATPILLMCAAGAWVLANAILRDSDAEMSGNRILGWAALALVVVVLPLTVFAAVSMGTRVAQHGLSPERLWGIVAIAVATAYGLAWLVAVARSWRSDGWRDNVRRANLNLAVLIGGVALLLALPILDFGAIAARNQVARLERGAVSAEDFDYSALRWNFGVAGRRALARLARYSDPEIAKRAREAQGETERRYPSLGGVEAADFTLRVQPADPALERLVRAHLKAAPWKCPDACVALDLGSDGTARTIAIVNGGGVERVRFRLSDGVPYPPEPQPAPATSADLARARVEVREWRGRQVYVNGQPVGQPFADAATPLEGAPPAR